MSIDRTIDALGLGIMPLDLLLTIPEFPELGGKVNGSALTIQAGGPVPNAMVGLARLGLTTAIISAVADDPIGQQVRTELQAEAVSTDYLVSVPGASDTALGFIEQPGGRRTIGLYRGAFVHADNLPLDQLPRPRVIHLDGRDLDACIALAQWGKALGAIISFDIGSIRNDVSPIFPLVDHLVVADAYALPFTGTGSKTDALRQLQEHCPGTVVITCGLDGQIGAEPDGSLVAQDAFPVNAVDTTGAGDAFHVGYLFGLLNNWPLDQRLRYGSAVAALKCLKPGARGGLPGQATVAHFLSERG